MSLSEEEAALSDREQEQEVKRLPTLPAAVIQIILCIGQIVLVFILPAFYDPNPTEKDWHGLGAFSLLIYVHTSYWAAFLFIDRFLFHFHHKSRQQGYLDFYVKTKNLRRAPFYILSVGNAVLMMVTVILNDFCDTSFDCLHSLTKVDYLRGLLTLESLVVLCLAINYIYVLSIFHASRQPPDVLRDELWERQVVGSLEPAQVQQVMERQAEMIRYLSDRCEFLCGKLQDLSSELGRKESFSGMAPYQHRLSPHFTN